MYTQDMNIDQKLTRAQVALDNAMSDESIKALLLPFKYDDARLQEGKDLYNQASETNRKQQIEYAEQFQATEDFKNLLKEGNEAYMDAVKIARIALRDNTEKTVALGLNGLRKASFSGWSGQAQQFFSNALADPDVIAAMSIYGFDESILQTLQSKVQAVIDANTKQEKEKGEAQAATKERDTLIDQLDRWMSDFKVIAQIALRGNDQWLEKLGLGVVP